MAFITEEAHIRRRRRRYYSGPYSSTHILGTLRTVIWDSQCALHGRESFELLCLEVILYHITGSGLW